VLAADFFQTILNKAMISGVMAPPMPRSANPNFPIIQYADDTLIVLKANAPQLLERNSSCLLRIYWAQSKLFKVLYDAYQFGRRRALSFCKNSAM
jgi:hypothetical protein